jgi:hypothetical protein
LDLDNIDTPRASPHAHSFVFGTVVINTHSFKVLYSSLQGLVLSPDAHRVRAGGAERGALREAGTMV